MRYRGEGVESTAELWVSRDAKHGTGSMFAASGSIKQFRDRMPTDMPVGMLLVYAMSHYPKMDFGAKK